jgi:excisionase family DNA binding protein
MADQPLTYSIPEAAALLGISTWSYYQGIKRGELPALRLTPRRLVVPKVQLEALLAGGRPTTNGAAS